MTINAQEVETTEMNKYETVPHDEDDKMTTPPVIAVQEKMAEVHVADDDGLTANILQDSKDNDLRAKYIKLVEHNSKLVDLLRTTMQIQTDIFRKLIHYIFT